MKKDKNPNEIKIAKIGFAGLILAAIVTGLFAYINSNKPADPAAGKAASSNTNTSTNTNINTNTNTVTVVVDSALLKHAPPPIAPSVTQRERSNEHRPATVINQVKVNDNTGTMNVGTQNTYNLAGDSTKKRN